MVSTSSSSPPDEVTKRHPRRRAKRARVGVGSCSRTKPGHSNWRDWERLGCGPTMLIADRLLFADVADYVRFRAACSAWRHYTADPRDHALDRRFHPRRWILIKDVLGHGARPRYHHSLFENVATGEQIGMTIRGLNGRDGRTFDARTSQGLLVLLNKKTDEVWVVNPITGVRVDLPPVTTLLSGLPRDTVFPRRLDEVQFSAELTDDFVVVINVGGRRLLGVARPGDQHWAKVPCELLFCGFRSYAGRVYCLSGGNSMLLQTSPDLRPRLVHADKASNPFRRFDV